MFFMLCRARRAQYREQPFMVNVTIHYKGSFVVVDTFGWGADNPDEEELNFVKLPGFSVLVNHTQVLADAVCLAQGEVIVWYIL